MPPVPFDSCAGTQLGYSMPDNMLILFLQMFFTMEFYKKYYNSNICKIIPL